MKKQTTKLSCPTCQKLIQWNEQFPYRPFCCERCRLIDLGDWADESYRVPEKPDDHGD